MFSITLKQFKKYKESWLSFALLVFVASFLICTCMNVIVSVHKNHPEYINSGPIPNPINFYKQPLLYSGLVFVFVVANIVRFNIDSQIQDYRLFSLMGANSSQLSKILVYQSMIVTVVSTSLAYLLSISKFNLIYDFIAENMESPSVLITFDWTSYLVNLIMMLLVSSIASYVHSYRYFIKKDLDDVNSQFDVGVSQKLGSISKVALTLLIIGVGYVIYETIIKSRTYGQDYLDGYMPEMLGKVSTYFFFPIMLVLIIAVIRKPIYSIWLKFIRKLAIRTNSGKFLLASSNIAYYFRDYQAFVIPIMLFSTLASAINSVASVLTEVSLLVKVPVDDMDEVLLFVYINYLAAVFIIVIANAVIIYPLILRKSSKDDVQYKVIGLDRRDILKVRLIEVGINIAFVLIISLIIDTFFYFVTAAFNMKSGLNPGVLNYKTTVSVLLFISVIMIISLLVTHLISNKKTFGYGFFWVW